MDYKPLRNYVCLGGLLWTSNLDRGLGWKSVRPAVWNSGPPRRSRGYVRANWKMPFLTLEHVRGRKCEQIRGLCRSNVRELSPALMQMPRSSDHCRLAIATSRTKETLVNGNLWRRTVHVCAQTCLFQPLLQNIGIPRIFPPHPAALSRLHLDQRRSRWICFSGCFNDWDTSEG